MTQKKGNISVLIMLIMASMALIGVLTTNFFQYMARGVQSFHDYYSAYYLSKAGLEMGLSQTQGRLPGFSYVSSGLVGNFECKEYCDVKFEVVGKSKIFPDAIGASGCQEPMVLAPGESMVLPLFVDGFSGSLAQSFTSAVSFSSLVGAFAAQNNPFQYFYHGSDVEENISVSAGFLALSGNDLMENQMLFMTGDLSSVFLSQVVGKYTQYVGTPRTNNLSIKRYFLIANRDTQSVSFCLSLGDIELALPFYVIESFGSFGFQKVGLEARSHQNIPNFALDNNFEFIPSQ